MSEINNQPPVVYVYSPGTFEFTQTYFLDEGEVIKFDNYTTIPCSLDDKEGFCCVFNTQTEQWEHVEDHRGFPAYSIATKEEILVDYLGEIKEGFTTDTPISDTCIWEGGVGWIETNIYTTNFIKP